MVPKEYDPKKHKHKTSMLCIQIHRVITYLEKYEERVIIQYPKPSNSYAINVNATKPTIHIITCHRYSLVSGYQSIIYLYGGTQGALCDKSLSTQTGAHSKHCYPIIGTASAPRHNQIFYLEQKQKRVSLNYIFKQCILTAIAVHLACFIQRTLRWEIDKASQLISPNLVINDTF